MGWQSSSVSAPSAPRLKHHMYIHSLAHMPLEHMGDRVPKMKEKWTKSQEESTCTGRRVSIVKGVHFNVAIAITVTTTISSDWAVVIMGALEGIISIWRVGLVCRVMRSIDIGLSCPSRGGRTDIILYSVKDDRDRECWLLLWSWSWSIIGVIAIAIADSDEWWTTSSFRDYRHTMDVRGWLIFES